MKKLLVLWVLVAFVSPGLSATLEVSKQGQYRVFTGESWVKVPVHVDDDAAQHPDEVIQAYIFRDTVVPIATHTAYSRDGLFHVTGRKTVDIGVVYDGKSISVVHDAAGTSTSFNPFAILWLISVLLMALAVSKACESENKGTLATTSATIASYVAFASATTSATITPAYLAFVFAFAVIFARAANNKKTFYIFVGIYGVCMVSSMVAFLFS